MIGLITCTHFLSFCFSKVYFPGHLCACRNSEIKHSYMHVQLRCLMQCALNYRKVKSEHTHTDNHCWGQGIDPEASTLPPSSHWPHLPWRRPLSHLPDDAHASFARPTVMQTWIVRMHSLTGAFRPWRFCSGEPPARAGVTWVRWPAWLYRGPPRERTNVCLSAWPLWALALFPAWGLLSPPAGGVLPRASWSLRACGFPEVRT